MKRSFTVKPKIVQASSDTRNRISDLQNYIDKIEAELADPNLDEDRRIDLQMDLAEAKDNLNYAWQDDEAEYNYALEQQEFNPDGSLKGYDDYSGYEVGPEEYTYSLRICYRDEEGNHCGVERVVAETPQEAVEYLRRGFPDVIDKIELVGIDDDNFSDDPVRLN